MNQMKTIECWKKQLNIMKNINIWQIALAVMLFLCNVAIIIFAIYYTMEVTRNYKRISYDINSNSYTWILISNDYNLFFILLIFFCCLFGVIYITSTVLAIILTVKCYKYDYLFTDSIVIQILAILGIFLPLIEFIFNFICLNKIRNSKNIIKEYKNKQSLKDDDGWFDIKNSSTHLDVKNLTTNLNVTNNQDLKNDIKVDDEELFNTLKSDSQNSEIKSSEEKKYIDILASDLFK